MEYTRDYDYLFKLLMLGDTDVGKTSLLRRFADDTFTYHCPPTIGIDFKIRTVEIEEEEEIPLMREDSDSSMLHQEWVEKNQPKRKVTKAAKLQIWDTAGQERFRTITSAYYRGAQGIVLCYDTTNLKSLENLRQWHSEIQRYTRNTPVLMVVGTKADLIEQRQVKPEDVQSLVEELRCDYVETSAVSDHPEALEQKVFLPMAYQMREAQIRQQLSIPIPEVDLTSLREKDEESCCF